MRTTILEIDDLDKSSLGHSSSGGVSRDIRFGSRVASVGSRKRTLDDGLRSKLVAGDLAYQEEMKRQRDEGVDFLSRQTRELAMGVERPKEATHKIIDGHYPGIYVKFLKLTDDGNALLVEFIDGHRKGMFMRVMPNMLVDAKTNEPDLNLCKMIDQGLPVAHLIGSKYRK